MAKNNEYVKKRKSYYGFAKNYPGKLGSSKYVIGESRIVRRNEIIRKIVIAIIVILLFIASYVITSVGFNISERKTEKNKTTSVSIDTDVVFISCKWKMASGKFRDLRSALYYILYCLERSFPLTCHF